MNKTFFIVALSMGFLGTAVPVSAITLEDVQSSINSLSSQMQDLKAQLSASAVLSVGDDVDPNPDASTCVIITNDLRYRSRDANTNGEVSTLQDFLQSQGYLNSEPTGYFGLMTQKAVKSFQSANGISPTGFVGPVTRAKIKAISCGRTDPPSPTTIKVGAPNGGETWTRGTEQKIWWDQGISWDPNRINKNVDIRLNSYVTPGSCRALSDGRMVCSQVAVLQPYTIVKNASGPTYIWTVRNNIDKLIIPDGSYYVEVCITGTNTCDQSDSYFKIVSGTATNEPSVKIESYPSADSAGKVTIKVGDKLVITGYPYNLSGRILVDYNRAFFFGSIFNNACGNTDWEMTCVAKQAGVSKFYIEAYKNSTTYWSNVIEVTVVDANRPSISVLSPNGGETWARGTTQRVHWSGANSNSRIDLRLYSHNECISCGYPVRTYVITKNILAETAYNWSVGQTDEAGVVPDGQYIAEVCFAGTNIYDKSDSYFKIVTSTTGNQAPQIAAYDIPTRAAVGQEVNFSWTAKDADNDDLSWSINWGDNTGVQGATSITPCTQTGRNWSLTTSHSWTQAGTYKVVATASDCKGLTDTNIQYITVGNTTNQSSITVTSPNGGETFTQGSANKISWSGSSGVVQVGLVKESANNYTNPGGNPYLLLGWINTSVSADRTITWGGKQVCDLMMRSCWSVVPGRYKIIVVTADANGNYVLWDSVNNKPGNWDVSDGAFTIATPSITVTSPNGGETWVKGILQTIKWQDNTSLPECSTGTTLSCLVAQRTYNIKLSYYYPPCTSNVCPMYPYVQPFTIANNVSGSSYNWSVGKLMDADLAKDSSYNIEVCISGTNTCDKSDSYFKILNANTYTVTAVARTPVSAGANIIPNITFSILNATGTTVKTVDSSSGIFKFEGLTAGTYTVKAGSATYPSQTVQVVVGSAYPPAYANIYLTQ